MFVTVHIDCAQITSMETFHDVFHAALGFPDFYGRNMDAWIDCMTYVDCPEDGMTTKVTVPKGGMLILRLNHVNSMIAACPTAYEALVEDVAFVNYRRMENNELPVLALAYYADPNR